MVPFERHVQRLARIVRRAAGETGKRAELIVEGASATRPAGARAMLPPFEHMLRNAVVHGIEKPEERRAARQARHRTHFSRAASRRRGSHGAPHRRRRRMNLSAIRQKAETLGLIGPGHT